MTDFNEIRDRYAGRSLEDILWAVDSGGDVTALTACRLLGVTAIDLNRMLHEYRQRLERRRSTYDACVVAALWRRGLLWIETKEPFLVARLNGLADQVAREPIYRQWIETLPLTETNPPA